MPSNTNKSREKLFFLVLIFIPILFFVLLELGLRIFHYGPNTDLFIPLNENPAYLKINPELGTRYFPSLKVKPAVSYDIILKQKPANGFRVFVLGGSSAYGYPYGRNGAFSKFLQDMLQDYLPQRKVEVMNQAMCAVGSYTVRDIGLELLNYKPDALLIYAGHNEFYGALGVGSNESLGRSRRWVNLYLKMQRYKTVQLVRDGVVKIKSIFRGKEHAEAGKRLMEHLAGNKIIPYNSEQFHVAHKNFRGNINDVIEAAARKNVAVHIGDLVSNVRDQAPFRSVFSHENPNLGKLTFLVEALKMIENDCSAQRLERLTRALQSDSANADIYYMKARCLDKSGKFSAAREHYHLAKDHDALRFRASEALNKIIRDFRKAKVGIVPVQKTFEHNSEHHLIGNSLMLDHLHPNLQGYFLLAKVYFEAMKNRLTPAAGEAFGAVRPDSVYWHNAGVTALDLSEADFRMQILLSSWPFKEGFASVDSIQWNSADKVQQLAKQIIKEEKTWEQAHVELAEYYIKRGQLNLAAEEYLSLVKMTPYNASPYIRLGQIFMQSRRFDVALHFFLESLDIEKSLLAFQGIGEAYLHMNQPQKGIPYLEKGLAMKKNDPLSLFLLARSYFRMGDRAQAGKFALQLKSIQPNFPGLTGLFEKLN